MAAFRSSFDTPVQGGEEWLDLSDEAATDLLRHLQSDNRAFENLRHALERDESLAGRTGSERMRVDL